MQVMHDVRRGARAYVIGPKGTGRAKGEGGAGARAERLEPRRGSG